MEPTCFIFLTMAIQTWKWMYVSWCLPSQYVIFLKKSLNPFFSCWVSWSQQISTFRKEHCHNNLTVHLHPYRRKGKNRVYYLHKQYPLTFTQVLYHSMILWSRNYSEIMELWVFLDEIVKRYWLFWNTRCSI